MVTQKQIYLKFLAMITEIKEIYEISSYRRFHASSAPTDLQVTKTHPEQSGFLGH